MDKELLKEQERFYEFIKNYEFINNSGRLDLEAFCVNLSMCFNCDGVLEQSPHPDSVYELLIYLLSNYATKDEMDLWVQTQKIIDWKPVTHTCILISTEPVFTLPEWFLFYTTGSIISDIL